MEASEDGEGGVVVALLCGALRKHKTERGSSKPRIPPVSLYCPLPFYLHSGSLGVTGCPVAAPAKTFSKATRGSAVPFSSAVS